jgi:hypothetical protein
MIMMIREMLENYHPKIRNSFAAFENLKQDSRDIGRAWGHIGDCKK